MREDEPQSPINDSFLKTSESADTLLDENDYVGSLRAINVPGSMAFYDERSKVLVAGDAFHTRPALTVTGDLIPLFPFPALATWNKAVALRLC
ncbi:hypothetical protein [uncultured Vagococcus sp.]|uniref:hypothetical protein n=1 Tax=uncultured Vagococcus sp. TaxID=189676 RepID=UPI0028D50826|nr:hypothetical protein [uncultured Vagococcus sp.]